MLSTAVRATLRWRGPSPVFSTVSTNAKFLPKNSRFFSSRSAPVVGFKELTFGYTEQHTLLDEATFSVREGAKVTIMGQNGSGKSTIIKLLSKSLKPESGRVVVRPGEKIACAMQTMPVEARDKTVLEFFTDQLDDPFLKDHEILKKMGKALKSVVLKAPPDRIIKSFSGGQQARLLLAAALVNEPSVLVLDEPTNNLDADGLWHLQCMIQESDRTCLVISHDEDFLNSFTDQVLYLDMFSKKVEQYDGDYFFVKKEISKRIKRENTMNEQLEKKAQAKKDQANKFANKGGGMRKVAKTMRSAAEEMESKVVDVRKEDFALKDFSIPFRCAQNTTTLVSIEKVSSYNREAKLTDPLILGKRARVQVCGPNGIGKTTFLEMIVDGSAPGVTLADGVSIGYYRQDFHNFDFQSTVLSCLEASSNMKHEMQEIRQTAAAFFLRGKMLTQPVGTLSEGQKGLLSLACLKLQEPSVLIMDEPTNHINFRHLPALAKMVSNFQGTVILVSHDYNFIQDVGVDITLDMGKELENSEKQASA